MDDPLSDLAPFLERARKSKPEFPPPEYLTARLMKGRGGGLEPAVVPVPEEPRLPRPFGPYMLEAILGRGGAGTVYRAYDAELERSVAVKILSPSDFQDSDSDLRFLREARAMAKLSDDNLMPLLAVHQDTPSPCFTMPLLQGETLEDLIQREGSLSVEATIRLGEQICLGLATAHDADLVHRDLKPSNIFLEETADGPRARLMDFGLVKAGEDLGMTREGEVIGTPSFMALEQIDGKNVDGRTDLYALGATLFMCLTGKPPFQGKTLTATLKQASLEEAPDLSKLNSNIPTWLSSLVSELLAKEASARPVSAQIVCQRLRERRERATAIGSAVQVRWLLGAFLAAALVSVVLWFSYSHFLENDSQPEFNFASAISSLESGDIWQVPAGTYLLESIDLQGKDLRIEGASQGTRINFANLSDVAFANAGNLELVNLTINCSRSGEGGTTPLLESTGSSVMLIDCRIEQDKTSNNFPDNRTLIETAPGSKTLIRGCELYTFQSVTWRMRGDASLVIEDSLIFSPGLSFSSVEEVSSGQISVKDSTCLHQLVVSHMGSSQQKIPIGFAIENSILECSHSFLWLPLGDEKTLRSSLSYRANNSLFLISRGLVNTSPRPRISSRRRDVLDRWQEQDWAAFWQNAHGKVSIKDLSLIARGNFTDESLQTLDSSLLNIPKGFENLGADLTRVGP